MSTRGMPTGSNAHRHDDHSFPPQLGPSSASRGLRPIKYAIGGHGEG